MRNICLLGIILLLSIFSSAQQDEKAKSILDQVSEKARSFQTIQADFSFTVENEEMDINESNDGFITIKGKNYHLKMKGLKGSKQESEYIMEVFSNGTMLWNYMREGNQVTISEIDEESNDLMDPSSLFSIYEKGFQSKFISEKNEGNKVLYLIELFPDDEELDVTKINIAIDKSSMMIHSATLLSTDENLYGILVKKMETNKTFPDSDFVFDASKYDDIEVIDFR